MPAAEHSTDKSEILKLEPEARSAWWTHIDGIDPDATRPNGWSLKDVVAHIAAWHRYSSGGLAALGRGQPDPGPPDGFNDRAREASLAHSRDDIRVEAERAHERFVSTIASLSDETLTENDALAAFLIAANGVEHYEEHLVDVFEVR